jgi:hypothetical protein
MIIAEDLMARAAGPAVRHQRWDERGLKIQAHKATDVITRAAVMQRGNPEDLHKVPFSKVFATVKPAKITDANTVRLVMWSADPA